VHVVNAEDRRILNGTAANTAFGHFHTESLYSDSGLRPITNV